MCVTRELLMSPAELPASDIRTFTRYGARMLQLSPTSAVRKDSPGNRCLHWYDYMGALLLQYLVIVRCLRQGVLQVT